MIVTRVTLRPDGGDGGLFYRKVPSLRAFVEGSPYAEFIEGLAPAADELTVTKQYPSAFFGTTLPRTSPPTASTPSSSPA